MNILDFFTVLHETGVSWAFYRFMYMIKLKMLNKCPRLENIFEKKANVKRLDIFNVDTEPIEQFLLKLSETDKCNIIKRADLALEGKIMAFSNKLYDYGNPIDWQKNPDSGISIDKKKKWYSIADFEEQTGDIKSVWEISRFSHLFFFLRAYMLTKDKKYYVGYVQQIRNWLQENEYSYGANFKCGQECALRIMNVLAVYGVFKKYGVTTAKDEKILIHFVEINYRKIMSNFFYAHRCVKIDHLISELCGMIICAWCCEDRKKIDKFFSMLNQQILEQFNQKGMYVSYSLNYQRYVMQLIAYMIKLQDRLGVYFDERAKERLTNATVFLSRVMGNSGRVPNYGANDGTLIFPITTCEFSDFRPIVNTMLGLLKGWTYYEQGNYSEEYLWFTGTYAALNVVKPSASAEDIDGSGFFLLANDKMKAIINAHEYERRPGHMDQLHFDLWIGGDNVFCDTGTYSYALKLGDHLRGNEGHNVVCIRNVEQMKRMGHFLNYAMPRVKILKRTNSEISCRADFRTGYSHRRTVILEDRFIKIKDAVSSQVCKKDYSILFHTPYDVKLNGNKANIISEDGILICTLESREGVVTVEKEYASYQYLDKHEINKIRIRCTKEYNNVVIEVKV